MAEKDKSDNKAKAASLSERIRQLEESQEPARLNNKRAAMSSNGLAMSGRVTTELVAGLVVGTGVGWALDQWLDTAPFLMVVMFFFRRSSWDDECLEGAYRSRYGCWIF